MLVELANKAWPMAILALRSRRERNRTFTQRTDIRATTWKGDSRPAHSPNGGGNPAPAEKVTERPRAEAAATAVVFGRIKGRFPFFVP